MGTSANLIGSEQGGHPPTVTSTTRFNADDSIERNQTLYQILFGRIPGLPKGQEPFPKTTTHFSAPRKENELGDNVEIVMGSDAERKKQVYEKAILPEIDHSASFLSPDREEEFKSFLRAQLAGMEKKYLGFPSTSFRDRSYKTELDAA